MGCLDGRRGSPPKKLKEVARAWALNSSGKDDPTRPATIDQDVAADFAALGVSVEAGDEEDSAIAVWDTNWKSVEAFLDCQTQWRLAVGFGAARWLGLDYAGVDAFLRGRFRNRALRRRIFEDLRVMEFVALRTFDEVKG
ncbi:MAG: DUF1799 domain-containing protein [Rhizobiaceae bacterium]|nr:DUF1799 domain-containing protein [Rhizobiaceae bacterium]